MRRAFVSAAAFVAVLLLLCSSRAPAQTIVGPFALPTPFSLSGSDVVVGAHAGQGTVGIPLSTLGAALSPYAPVISVSGSGAISCSGTTAITCTLSVSPITVSAITATGLTPGDCVQAGAGGLLQTTTGACGLASGSTLTGLTAGIGISVGSGANPTVGLSHGDYLSTLSAGTGLSVTAGPTPTVSLAHGDYATAFGRQAGSVTNVAADGSACSSITFPSAYASSVANIQITISPPGSTFNGYAYGDVVPAGSVSLTGFVVCVFGAPSASVVTLYWTSAGT